MPSSQAVSSSRATAEELGVLSWSKVDGIARRGLERLDVTLGETGAMAPVVYYWCMARTNVDLDDEACRAVMVRYRLSTKREAVNFALRIVAGEPLDLHDARSLRGSGWEGDLDEMRSGRIR